MQELTPAEVGIVKLAAAMHMKKLVPNIRPETADYIFARHIQKMSAQILPGKQVPPVKPMPPVAKAPKQIVMGNVKPVSDVGKLATILAATIQKLADDTPGEEAVVPEVPKTTPAKANKPKGKKPAPSETVGPQPTDENEAE